MFLKKKKFKNFQIFLKLNYKKIETKRIIIKSIWRNHYITPLTRLSLNVEFAYSNKFNYFWSHQKLLCPFSLIKKVPNKCFLFSRFFLNKKLNTFKINNVYK